MLPKVLFVDDELNILRAFKRQMYAQFDMALATSGPEALDVIAKGNNFAVICADMRMPGMDGIELLRRVREKAPLSVRLMLTGDADQQTALRAVNEGNIFRFLNKPCSAEELANAVLAGVAQHNLMTAEKELLHNTLSGSIKVLTDILAIIDPVAFGRGRSLKGLIHKFCEKLNIENNWELELAAMLLSIGWVVIPAVVTHKVRAGLPLSDSEQVIVDWAPEKGATLLSNIPRLEQVAKIVLYQNKHFDGHGFPKDNLAGKNIPIGARIIALVRDYYALEASGTNGLAAVAQLRKRVGHYDPQLVDNLEQLLEQDNATSSARKISAVMVKDLAAGNLLAADLMTTDGVMLAPKGTVLTATALDRINNYAKLIGVVEPISVETD